MCRLNKLPQFSQVRSEGCVFGDFVTALNKFNVACPVMCPYYNTNVNLPSIPLILTKKVCNIFLKDSAVSSSAVASF